MAYSAGAATDLPDLFSKIETFITANGWTVDEADSFQGYPCWHKNSCYISFRYDGANPNAAGRSCGIYQSTGYSGTGTKPGAHTNDSGMGYWVAGTAQDSSIDNGRCLYRCGDGPFNYWIFEYDSGGVFYVHVVLEVRQGEYRHFGMGMLEKFGDWGGHAGGEYVYGSRMESSWFSADTTVGLDGGNTGNNTEAVDSQGSIRVGGSYPGKELSDWAGIGSRKTKYTSSQDRAGVQRSAVLGNGRLGPITGAYGQFTGYPGFTGVIPMSPYDLFFIDFIASPFRTRFLGTWKDVRWLSIANFAAAEEVVIGSDTWVMFPQIKKGTLGGTLGDSYYAGIAYRKDVT